MLYKKTAGRGRPLYLLHGWALNSRVWDSVIDELRSRWTVTTIDLPGHGKSALPASGGYTLEALTDVIAPEIEPDAMIIGWSLGGMLAMNLALHHPPLVSKLIMVASSPQFARSADWPHAVDAEIIDGFAANLCKDYRQTILRFLAIQAMGSEHAREAIRGLREKVFLSGEPHILALQGGLDILLSTNLRPLLDRLSCDVQFLLGEKDTLVPQLCGAASTALIPGSRCDIIAGAAHAPFVTHAKQFIQLVDGFLNE